MPLPTDAPRRIPRGIWALGFVSLLMDVSSEMIHALLPVYMVSVLGTTTIAVGLIEGIAESTASITKVVSGALSDWLGRRKALAALGYGLAAATKPVFPLAGSLGWLVAARFVDRIGKGIRGAPRDALIADLSPPELRGASFGLRQSLDAIGAFAGPLLAIGLMWLTANQYRTVFWVAVIPAVLSVLVLLAFVHEPAHAAQPSRARFPLSRSELRQLDATYWRVVVLAACFLLARFSEAFLILRAQSVGVPIAMVPLVLVIINVVFAGSAYPVGWLADRVSRLALLAIGLVLLLAADLILAMTNHMIGLGIGVAVWGLHLGFSQGLLSTLVADAAPVHLRGTAFGMFSLVTGVALLLASVVAGVMWERLGPQATFLTGAALAGVTLLILWVMRAGLPRMRHAVSA